MRPVANRLVKPLILPIAACLVLGCQGESFQLGAVLPLSGPDQGYGESARRGLELALEELKAEGAPIELEIVDSRSDPEVAARQLRALVDEHHALAAVGGVTPREAEALAPLAEELERVLLSPSSSNQDLSDSLRYFYRLAPAEATAGSTLASFVTKQLNVETAMVIAEDAGWAEAFEKGFRPIFQAGDGELLDTVEAPAANGDLSAAVDRIGEQAPAAVVLSGYGEWLAAAIRQLRAAGYDGRVLTTQTVANRAWLDTLDTDLEGVLFSYSAFAADPPPQTRAFLDAYRAKYGQDPDIFAAEAYDALKVMALAVEGRPPLASEVRRGLRDAVKDYSGVTGTLEFDDSGSVSKFLRVYSVDDDGDLYDYGDWLEREEEERLRKIQEIRQRMRELQEQASSM